MARLTIIVPTAGTRAGTLVRTLASIAPQLEPGDEVMVACNSDANYGDRAIDRCQAKADGDVVLFCDDDDVYLDGALRRIRAWVDANPGRIGLFRRAFNNGSRQWRLPEMTRGNIQRMCIVLPNVPGKMPTWTGCESEMFIARDAAELQGTDYVFVDDVIGLARPHELTFRLRIQYALRLRSRLRQLRGARYDDAVRSA